MVLAPGECSTLQLVDGDQVVRQEPVRTVADVAAMAQQWAAEDQAPEGVLQGADVETGPSFVCADRRRG